MKRWLCGITCALLVCALGCSKNSSGPTGPNPGTGLGWRVLKAQWDFSGWYGLSAVTWANGQFVAVGGDTVSYTSTDGLNWQSWPLGVMEGFGSCYLQDISYGRNVYGDTSGGGSAGYYVAVGDRRSIITSQDGHTWKRSTGDPAYPFDQRYTRVRWANDRYVSIGFLKNVFGQPDINQNMIQWSDTGAYWNYGTQPDTILPREPHAIEYGNGKWVIVGDTGMIMTSLDGEIWTPRDAHTRLALYNVVWNGTSFFAYTDSNVVLTSSDGSTWSQHSLNIKGFRNIHMPIWTGSKFVGARVDTVFTSTDGLTWSFDYAMGGGRTIYGIAYSGSRYVAVGEGGFILTAP